MLPLIHQSNNMDNPNGKYFKIRRRIAIGCVVAIALNMIYINITLRNYLLNQETVMWFVIYNLCFCGLCGLYITVYAILVFSHDVQFEKIAKLGMDFYKKK